MNKTAPIVLAALVVMALLPFPAFAGEYPRVMFILDGSGSMWGPSEESTKIEIVRDVMSRIIPALPPEVEAGLTAYGHRRKGDCEDMEIISAIGAADREKLLQSVMSISPKGKTPIAATVGLVTEAVRSSEGETTVVLVSDGEETCHDDPCGAVRAMKEAGVGFVLHVVGFGVTEMEKTQLSCLAEAGGGSYFGADNAGDLLAALDTISAEMVVKVEKAKAVAVKSKSGLGRLRLMVRRRFDNEYPLWQNFLVPPGTYDVHVHLDGMDEPLAVGEGIEIAPGSLVVFDTGL